MMRNPPTADEWPIGDPSVAPLFSVVLSRQTICSLSNLLIYKLHLWILEECLRKS